MRRTLLLAALPLVLAAAAAHAQPISPQTTDFITKATSTDAFELAAGRLAEKRGSNPQVRAFGGMMVKDHTMTTNDLRQVLLKNHLPMPSKPSPGINQAKQLADLQASPKGAFDRAYIHTQVMAHEQALKLMKDYADHGDNPDVRQAAAKTMKLVQNHLTEARNLEFVVGGTSNGLARHED